MLARRDRGSPSIARAPLPRGADRGRFRSYRLAARAFVIRAADRTFTVDRAARPATRRSLKGFGPGHSDTECP